MIIAEEKKDSEAGLIGSRRHARPGLLNLEFGIEALPLRGIPDPVELPTLDEFPSPPSRHAALAGIGGTWETPLRPSP